jgi:hypothetical protein
MSKRIETVLKYPEPCPDEVCPEHSIEVHLGLDLETDDLALVIYVDGEAMGRGSIEDGRFVMDSQVTPHRALDELAKMGLGLGLLINHVEAVFNAIREREGLAAPPPTVEGSPHLH